LRVGVRGVACLRLVRHRLAKRRHGTPVAEAAHGQGEVASNARIVVGRVGEELAELDRELRVP
jgi:hypothetical protein